jgi:peptidoglycan/xylan/chitin deacetylase (PgdA/CDA1 family)
LINQVFIRDDDILGPSSEWKSSFGRFKQIHEWLKDAPNFIHIPTIMVNDIKSFPECIEYIKEETKLGFMQPEIHCLDHVDYGPFSKEKVRSDLEICKEFIAKELAYLPTRWYTPWGASQPHLHEVASELQLKLIDCSALLELSGQEGVVQQLRKGVPLSNYYGKELFIHYWSRGNRVKRVCQVYKYGSWQAAVKADPELYKGL